ncbi:DNA repair protein RecO [Flavobacterium agricola]|uniref:DNA repair protein RecO n=1 Tax=Flavobacterium agricola TaxID=2870839 RepID=A0ABY6LXP0_9FLAO|nr:DNA repair protein RecO [Flavobacterium agricola]UYW01076.1 DNA repair protein RecO [Flavobacterium agricola]
MIVHTQALVLSALKYNEKSLIVKCYTLTDGVKTYFVPSAFSSKKSQQKIAYFQPLNILDIVATHKNKGTLEHFKEIRIHTPYFSIPTDISKSTIVLFLSEVLSAAVKEEERNEGLFTFLITSFMWLDAHDEVANFHLIFLVELSKYLGIFPDNNEDDLPFFDVKEGMFVSQQGFESLNEYETLLFKNLLNLRYGAARNIFKASERQVLLKTLVEYYSYHLDGFRRPKSLEILKDVFS